MTMSIDDLNRRVTALETHVRNDLSEIKTMLIGLGAKVDGLATTQALGFAQHADAIRHVGEDVREIQGTQAAHESILNRLLDVGGK